MPAKRQAGPVYEPLRAGAFFNSRRQGPACESCPGCIPIPVVLTVCGKVNPPDQRGHARGVTVTLQIEGVHTMTANHCKLEGAMRAVRGWLDLVLTQPRGMA